ncbi:hypothetical protein [Streptomyces somaliensis]|uniref:hypothetical protein n=1 Tax=Streptomyces somaliensis TaxID=78355 RepID=UPI003F750C21
MNTTAPALIPTTRVLAWCLHLLVAGLLALAGVRAAAGGHPHAGRVVAAAVACGLLYAAGPALPRVGRSRRAAALWLAGVAALWLVLLALSADGVWMAFPLYFLQLHLLPRRAGPAAVAATATAAVAGSPRTTGRSTRRCPSGRPSAPPWRWRWCGGTRPCTGRASGAGA